MKVTIEITDVPNSDRVDFIYKTDPHVSKMTEEEIMKSNAMMALYDILVKFGVVEGNPVITESKVTKVYND